MNYRIPNNTALRDRWIASIGRERWNPTQNARVCSDHFLEQDLDRKIPSCSRIRFGAIPVSRINCFPVTCTSDNLSSYVSAQMGWLLFSYISYEFMVHIPTQGGICRVAGDSPPHGF